MSDLETCPFPKHEGRAFVEWLVSGEPDFEMWDDMYDFLIELLEET